MQSAEKGTRKRKGPKYGKGNGKATNDRKGNGKAKCQANGKGKGVVKRTPGGDYPLSCLRFAVAEGNVRSRLGHRGLTGAGIVRVGSIARQRNLLG